MPLIQIVEFWMAKLWPVKSETKLSQTISRCTKSNSIFWCNGVNSWKSFHLCHLPYRDYRLSERWYVLIVSCIQNLRDTQIVTWTRKQPSFQADLASARNLIKEKDKQIERLLSERVQTQQPQKSWKSCRSQMANCCRTFDRSFPIWLWALSKQMFFYHFICSIII